MNEPNLLDKESLPHSTYNLTYHEFWVWIKENELILDELEKNTEIIDSKSSRNKLIENTKFIYLSFQAFLISFWQQEIETITLNKYYSILYPFLKVYLDREEIDYGDLLIYIDDEHLDKISEVRDQLILNLTTKRKTSDWLSENSISGWDYLGMTPKEEKRYTKTKSVNSTYN